MNQCLFCDVYISPRYVVCLDHMPLYREYKHTVWYKELVKMQKRQAVIDSKESISLYSPSLINLDYQPRYYGRRVLDHEKIKELRLSGKTHQEIADLLGCPLISVKKVIYRKYKELCQPKR